MLLTVSFNPVRGGTVFVPLTTRGDSASRMGADNRCREGRFAMIYLLRHCVIPA
jgi:hypothetical protein